MTSQTSSPAVKINKTEPTLYLLGIRVWAHTTVIMNVDYFHTSVDSIINITWLQETYLSDS